jgi:hypothetical protein
METVGDDRSRRRKEPDKMATTKPYGCGKNKISWKSRMGAREHLRSLERWERAFGQRRGKLKVYWCAPCEGYHVGHSSMHKGPLPAKGSGPP